MASSLSASQARVAIPSIPYGLVLTMPGDLDDLKIRYVHHLVARGELSDIRAYLDLLTDEEVRHLVDTAIYHTWFGNTLHTATYWNTGENALAIVAYLVSKGATFFQDYYGKYPWENTGVLYVSPLMGATLGDRIAEEFEETYAALRALYAPADAAAPDAAAGPGAAAGPVAAAGPGAAAAPQQQAPAAAQQEQS